MRIYEIDLSHGEKRPVSYTAEEIYYVLQQRCTQALSAMKGAKKVLYRGIADYSMSPILHARTRIDRTTATLDDVRREIDQVFAKNGLKALRTNSISCTSSYGDAGNFGSHVFAIIPVDGFHFTWSPYVDDFGMMTGGDWGVNKMPQRIRDADAGDLEDLLMHIYKYTDTNFEGALASGHEVSISGEYYAVDTEQYADLIRQLKT